MTQKRKASSISEPIPGWLREIVSENGKFNYDDKRIKFLVRFVFDSHREICTRLQECVQRHNLGLGGEPVDVICVAELDRLLSANPMTNEHASQRTELSEA